MMGAKAAYPVLGAFFGAPLSFSRSSAPRVYLSRLSLTGVGDTLRLTFVQHLHKGLQGTQAAGKAAISISMYQYFFNLVHGHSVVQPASKGGFQILQVAGGGIGGNGNDALLAETERVCLLC